MKTDRATNCDKNSELSNEIKDPKDTLWKHKAENILSFYWKKSKPKLGQEKSLLQPIF